MSNNLLSHFLDMADVESIREVQKSLENIVLPWEMDQSVPPNWVRVTAMGKRVGFVSCWLDGFGDPHHPEKHGWGYKGGASCWNGGGQACSGIEASSLSAKRVVDSFLTHTFPEFRIMGCWSDGGFRTKKEAVEYLEGLEKEQDSGAEETAVELQAPTKCTHPKGHFVDNQGYCHCCGIPMNEDWIAASTGESNE